MKLQYKLGFGFAVVILIIAVMLGAYLFNQETELFKNELKRRGISLAKNLSFNAEYGILVNNRFVLHELTKAVASEDDVVYSLVLDAEGVVLTHSEDRKTGVKYSDPISEAAVQTDIALVQVYRDVKQRMIYDISVPVRTSRENVEKTNLLFSESVRPQGNEGFDRVKIGVVRIGLSYERVAADIAKAQRGIVLLVLLSVLISLAVSVILIRFLVLPLKELVKATQQLSKGNLGVKLRLSTKDEIGVLADSFNQMSGDLKRSRDEIESYSRSLEEKVRERTKALEDSCKKLIETHKQLVQAGKMAAMGQMGAGIAHELNNPLGGVLGFAQRLDELLKGEPQESEELKKKLKYISIIEKETRRCKEIVEKLLDFSRISDSQMSDIDVNEVLAETVSIVKHQLDMANVKCETDFQKDLPMVLANSNQMEQVFMNLFLNAKKAMPEGGELKVSTNIYFPDKQLIESEPDKLQDKYVQVTVSDTGVGISPENIDKIFDPFFTTSKSGEGTGLGLSVSYNIIREHKGFMFVESVEGQGAVFKVLLPVL